MNKIFPMLCSGTECETEEEAWESFKQETNQLFSWIKGHKYWRRIPELQQDKDYSADRTVYVVRARAIASLESLDITEASVDGPYPKQTNMIETGDQIGFALASND